MDALGQIWIQYFNTTPVDIFQDNATCLKMTEDGVRHTSKRLRYAPKTDANCVGASQNRTRKAKPLRHVEHYTGIGLLGSPFPDQLLKHRDGVMIAQESQSAKGPMKSSKAPPKKHPMTPRGPPKRTPRFHFSGPGGATAIKCPRNFLLEGIEVGPRIAQNSTKAAQEGLRTCNAIPLECPKNKSGCSQINPESAHIYVREVLDGLLERKLRERLLD